MRMTKKVSDLLFATKMWFIARGIEQGDVNNCLLYTSPSPRDA